MTEPQAQRETWRAAERAARESYGRLVALLAWRWGDLAAAQDAVSDALAAALAHWPKVGVPASPDAWLMTAARNGLLQAARHRRVTADPTVLALFDAEPLAAEPPVLPDRRLELLFACAHPAIDGAVHAPLMLQTVLGIDARVVASAFLVAPATLAQRLVRAKSRIRATGIRFELPEAGELPPRLGAVLEAIYGAYTIGSDAAAPGRDAGGELADEAVYLGRLVVSSLPESAEAHGLLALMLYNEARRPAQFDADGRFVPLSEQDTSRWSRERIAEAESALITAARRREPGPFQTEAAIQAAHCQRAFTGQTPWPAVLMLYDTLVRHWPSIGARIGAAVAAAQAGDLARGRRALDDIDPAQTRDHAPYWVARAHLERLAGNAASADSALQRAIGLTEDPRVRLHLQAQRDLGRPPAPPRP